MHTTVVVDITIQECKRFEPSNMVLKKSITDSRHIRWCEYHASPVVMPLIKQGVLTLLMGVLGLRLYTPAHTPKVLAP